MDAVLTQMNFDLTLAGYAARTRAAYFNAARDFVQFHRRSADTLGHAELRAWVGHLAERGLSAQRRRQHHAALRFLYARTLGRPDLTAFLAWPRDAERLSPVLSPNEVALVLGALREPKYRVFFTMLYATGLRLREGCLLETRDIDSARGVIHVRHGKGGRERLAMLSPRASSHSARLLELRATSGTLALHVFPWNAFERRSRPNRARACGSESRSCHPRHAARAPAHFRDALARAWHRSPHHSGASRSPEHSNHRPLRARLDGPHCAHPESH